MTTLPRLARIFAVTAGLVPALAWSSPAVDLADGRRVYQQACAACHGSSGRSDPDSPVLAALETLPADLSDPLFNSREPAADWELVVAHGGHAMGLSAQMPAQQGTLTADEVRNVVAYVKTLADTSDYPPGELNYFLPIRTKKAFPEDEVVWKARYTPVDGGPDVLRNVIEVEKRVGTRGMVVLEVIHEDDGLDSEITKVEAGYKHVLAWNAARQSVLSGAVVLAFPTSGDESNEIIPYLAYARMLGDSVVLQSSARAITPFDDPGDGTLELAGALHYRWSPWPRNVFPGIELVAEAPYDSFGSDVQWSAIPQLRIGLTKGGHVALTLGVEAGLSDQPWDYRAHAVLLWDFADGSFFKGWR
jgi:mono/diheme cytochrome c family protein